MWECLTSTLLWRKLELISEELEKPLRLMGSQNSSGLWYLLLLEAMETSGGWEKIERILRSHSEGGIASVWVPSPWMAQLWWIKDTSGDKQFVIHENQTFSWKLDFKSDRVYGVKLTIEDFIVKKTDRTQTVDRFHYIANPAEYESVFHEKVIYLCFHIFYNLSSTLPTLPYSLMVFYGILSTLVCWQKCKWRIWR